jgi:diguanylate cyclase (GGDEF)-like protein
VSSQQASLLAKLRAELGGADGEQFAMAAQRLAGEFGSVTATAVDAAYESAASTREPEGPERPVPREQLAPQERQATREQLGPRGRPAPQERPELPERMEAPAEHRELTSLYQPGHMRRRLDQLIETNRRYGHPFGLAVFDPAGPGTRNGDSSDGTDTVLAIVGAALRHSIRIVDEVFRLEEDAICVLAPNLRTVEGVQMAERLLGQLEELERAGGLRISISAGVVACPDHGGDADELLRKADTAMWRARAVGQPVGLGALQDR